MGGTSGATTLLTLSGMTPATLADAWLFGMAYGGR
jgi:hypothetical protein